LRFLPQTLKTLRSLSQQRPDLANHDAQRHYQEIELIPMRVPDTTATMEKVAASIWMTPAATATRRETDLSPTSTIWASPAALKTHQAIKYDRVI